MLMTGIYGIRAENLIYFPFFI